jgi:hypothetical protein
MLGNRSGARRNLSLARGRRDYGQSNEKSREKQGVYRPTRVYWLHVNSIHLGSGFTNHLYVAPDLTGHSSN